MRSVTVTTAFLSGLLAAVGAMASGDEPLAAIPATILLDGKPLDEGKIALGHRLFFDKRLSKDGSMSCVSCHVMNEDGAGASPHNAKDKNIAGNYVTTNSPSVFNVPLSFRFAWDGDATLHDVINRPLTNHMNVPPVDEHGKPKPRDKKSAEQNAAEVEAWAHVVDVLSHEQAYDTEFVKIYRHQATRADVEDAIANYVMALAPRGSRFDDFLSGRDDAINANAKEGYRRFREYGCVSCHQGRGIGGNMVAELGVMFADDVDLQGQVPDIVEKDSAGRLKRYRVPSLRNVLRTAPYFHNGSAKTIEEAVSDMGQWQLGREIPPKDVESIVAFLATLNGTPDKKLLTDPFAAGGDQ